MSEFLSISASILSAIGAIYSMASYKKQKDDLSESYKKVVDSYATMLGRGSFSASDLMRVRHELQNILTGASEALSHISGKEIHASIKLLENDKENVNVVTFLRDQSSAPKREIFALKYPVRQNIAYATLSNDLDKDLYFVNNDLQKLEEGGFLHCGPSNNRWKNDYKSVLVVPIKGKNNRQLLGFLTFDSTEKSAFSDESACLAKSLAKVVSATLLKAFSLGDDVTTVGEKQEEY